MAYYILHNDELGFIDDCPVFTDKREAELTSAGKCRFHSVVEIDSFKPCTPVQPHSGCKKCPRFIQK